MGVEKKQEALLFAMIVVKKHNLPNPYETYSGITKQEVHYEKCLDNYTDEDLLDDVKYDR